VSRKWSIGERPIKRARSNQIFDFEVARVELSNRQGDSKYTAKLLRPRGVARIKK
jgi:hypothetical protein